LALQGKT